MMLVDGQAVGLPGFSPAAERNKAPILAQLQALLPASGSALEIASGTGQHIAWFAQGLPAWSWQPSDRNADAFATLMAHTTGAGLRNVRSPLVVDVLSAVWKNGIQANADSTTYDAIYCANMLHIAPWVTCAGLMQGAAAHLTPAGQLITYGPYFEDGVQPSPGNIAFNASLRASDPSWGIRRREDVESAAHAMGLRLQKRVAMPSNNLLLVFGQTRASPAALC